MGPASDYFTNSLLYLTYTPLADIPQDKQVRLAADVTLAALVGHHIYNFGELLQHPVVNVLEGTQHAWLKDMLMTFNAGDIGGFQKIFASKKASQAVLKENDDFLNQKIRIMALIEMIFQRNSNSRVLTFDEVAKHCELKVDQVRCLYGYFVDVEAWCLLSTSSPPPLLPPSPQPNNKTNNITRWRFC